MWASGGASVDVGAPPAAGGDGRRAGVRCCGAPAFGWLLFHWCRVQADFSLKF
jgi:hypothetical protein